jgi:hypothetical protein
MAKIEVKIHFDEELKKDINAIYVDDQVFDWGIDEQSLYDARNFIQNNQNMEKAIYGDIENHFIECFSEFLGRQITLQELVAALETGII